MNHTATWDETAIWSGRQTLALGRVQLEAGETLPEVEVAYETFGRLNAAKDNAVLICHALTGDAHAGGPTEEPGWWQPLIGPGKALDPERWYIICSNVLGGCNGTTGPQSPDPAQDGRPYGSRFPLITIRDMVNVQRQLVDALCIGELALVLGGSMGGLQVIEWAVSYPERVRACIPMAASGQLSALAIAYNEAMRSAIESDPAFAGGDYYGTAGPVNGLALARKIGMITYRSFSLFQSRFGHETSAADAPLGHTKFQIETYLDHQGAKLVNRFDANSYLRLIRAMDLHDIGRGRGGVEAAIQRIQSDLLWVGIDSDRLYPAEEQRAWAERILAQGKRALYREIASEHGHDAFLLEFDQINDIIIDFVGRVEGNTDGR
ncbi:homoserine O-acetyltransferase [Tumebacillus sp. DT12]|uniref:Homoserine O-acetyltransferase n=1 Tax=Tumebacillus lacus TaxID=2995335 RepID=A0ABT3X342_9BACL|nr:homoserine O-acetyltransferase [Tumebacillus lacus]MCX7571318.1 homoserine O-acetyltransferase [Tumebacillus lacus]